MTNILEIVADRQISASLAPLVVDLDGTLIKSDLLVETFFAVVGRNPMSTLSVIATLARGKAPLKERLAEQGEFDPAFLPYDETVLSFIREAKESGRDIYLASAGNWRLVKAVADHLGLFTGWMASDAGENLAGQRKADLLVARFGSGKFDYIGNDQADLAVWRHAGVAITVRVSAQTRAKLDRSHASVVHLDYARPNWKTWLRLLRVHQYTKNALVLVPLFTAHAFDLVHLLYAVLGVIAFSLCASSVYILNDLVDIQADRVHPTKQFRPLASGTIPIIQAVMAIPLLLLPALAIGFYISLPFLAVLGGYYCLTTAYSFVLKRKMLVDVVALAALYSIRVFAGAVAIDVTLSEWLLGFSMFMFMSLALIKRYVELTVRLDLGMADPTNRNYRVGDLQIVAMMAAVCGFNAVTVLALYISSPDVHILYKNPRLLWLLCPVIMYWVGRMLLMAHRRFVSEDPILFAVRDRVSLYTLGTCLVIALAAGI